MKYIILEKNLGEGLVQMVPVIFPNHLIHEDVAKALATMPHFETLKPVSAGFINMEVSGCHGKSGTLELSSRRDDSAIINSIDYFTMRTT